MNLKGYPDFWKSEPPHRILQFAISRADLNLVRQLTKPRFFGLSKSTLVSFRYEFQQATPLHFAAEKDAPAIVKLLLDYGADVNAVNEYLETPLHRAACFCKTEVAEILLARGADVNATNHLGETPLFIAAGKTEGTDIVKLLIAKGARVNVADKGGGTAFSQAKKYGNWEVVKLLAPKGAVVDDLNKPPDALLEDVIRMALGNNATLERIEPILRLAIQKGADVNRRFNLFELQPDEAWKNGFTPLLWLADENSVTDFENRPNIKAQNRVAQILIEAGANVNLAGSSPPYWTPLLLAAERGRLGMAKLLIEANADVTARLKDGSTPLSLASEPFPSSSSSHVQIYRRQIAEILKART